MKRLLDKFCIAVTVVVAVTMILCGKITTEERGENMLQGTQYKSVMLENRDDTISLHVDEGEVVFSKQAISDLLAYKRFVSFTPLSAVSYFIRCASELFAQ